MTAAAASGNALLDAHVRLIRDTADLVEASGIPAWSCPPSRTRSSSRSRRPSATPPPGPGRSPGSRT